MKQAVLLSGQSASLANLDLDNLERFGVYDRLHFEDRTYTNLEELDMAGALARLLRDYGVGPGDRVVVMMLNSPELSAAFPAIWTIGAAIVPVIPQWTAPEVAEILHNSGAEVALTVPPLAPRLAQAGAAAGGIKHLMVFGETSIPNAVNVAPLLTHGALVETPVDRAAE
jgi:long-chain acyl-CoA synthetase